MDKIAINQSIEDHIALCKSRKNLSDLDVASSLHMARQTLHNKRQGETSWMFYEILDLCELCECSPNELVDWKEMKE